MIRLIELNHSLTKVGANVLALTSRTPPSRSRDLCQVLKGVAWMLTGEIENVDTPSRREARRQLHIETVTLLTEIEATLRNPTPANYRGVRHRARAWNELLEHVRPTLGIRLGLPEARGTPPAGAAAADRLRRPTGPAPRAGGFFT